MLLARYVLHFCLSDWFHYTTLSSVLHALTGGGFLAMSGAETFI